MPDGFELDHEWVGTREHDQMDIAAAEVSGVALRSEYLWGHEFLENKQNPAQELWSAVQECLSYMAGGS
jgi:hypothetical protein